MNSALLKNLLVDVMHFGSSQVHRKKLAYYLGRTNITSNAWSSVLDEWVDLGNDRNKLYYLEWGDTFTFLASAALKADN
ncbi:hypothetical protein KX729_10480 [Rhizobium sp. XQZ8]|uniref:hypothetical protein n=1 Tax=Rhizobium populisoli TaxID=2859785 RepID=UPI001CA4A946|nr:hypothetical protein [Rhizobium populisoli]MBW6421869.1 hypothetical protein [Rhizobium populisoli]